MGISPNLRFSNNRSFRLFTEGVQALQSYEQSAQRASLDKAAKKFTECITEYQDVLPRLYLGIVRYYQGEAVADAVTLLREVLDRNIPELNPTAKYYLAEAYVSKYTPEDIAHADAILTELLKETSVDATDRLRAESLRTFTYVRQNLWAKRTRTADLRKEELEAEERLKSFKTDIETAKISEDSKTSLWSDYWNTQGLLQEYYATRSKDEPTKTKLVEDSLAGFEKALRYGANRADALSNQARVYYHLANNKEKAIRLSKEVLEIRTDDSFIHLLLGRIYESEQPDKAVHHYLKAEAKFLSEAALGAGRSYDKLEEFDSALFEFNKVEGSSRFFGEANYLAGRIQQRLGKKDEARESYQRVPKDSGDYFERAQEALKSLQIK